MNESTNIINTDYGERGWAHCCLLPVRDTQIIFAVLLRFFGGGAFRIFFVFSLRANGSRIISSTILYWLSADVIVTSYLEPGMFFETHDTDRWLLRIQHL